MQMNSIVFQVITWEGDNLISIEKLFVINIRKLSVALRIYTSLF